MHQHKQTNNQRNKKYEYETFCSRWSKKINKKTKCFQMVFCLGNTRYATRLNESVDD